jgi:hypothetical protein
MSAKAQAVIAGTILLIAAFVIYAKGFPHLESDATKLSAIVLVGLALTVVFMAILVIIYSVLGVENKDQALGLPEGSVRALLAFSLVLIFVCLATFLFSALNDKGCSNCGKTLTRVSDAQLSDLKANFIVAAEQARDGNGNLLYEQVPGPTPGASPVNDLKHPLYSVTYYPKQSTEAADFAKQIFTTLATIFVSVISFYFGSSVTASANKAGVIAGQRIDGDKQSAALQAALTSALADSHNAQLAVQQAAENLGKAQNAEPRDPAAIDAAQRALDDARKDLQLKQAKVQAAQTALNASTKKDAEPSPDQASS